MDESSSSEGDSDSVRVEIGSEPISEQGEFGTSPEPIPEFDESGVKPPLLFNEDVDDSFHRVADFDKEEEVEIPILAVQPLILKVSKPSEGKKNKNESKPLLDELISHLFVSSKPCKLKPPLLPHYLNPPSQNPQSNLQENHSG